jgi:hypothetical protein
MSDQPRGSQPKDTRLAVLYLRAAISSNRADNAMAIVAQQHVCSWRAHELGATVAGEFVDFGSGLSIERPGFTALLARLAELRAENAEAVIYVIVKDHARIARSMEAYSRVSWQIDQAGGVLNVASIPLAEYEALSGSPLERMSQQAIERSHSTRGKITRPSKEQPPTNQEN